MVTIAGYVPNQTIARYLAEDLRSAARCVSGAEWGLLFISSAKDAGRSTVTRRWCSLRRIGAGAIRTSSHVRHVGVVQASCDAWIAIQRAVRCLPVRTHRTWEQFRVLSRGRQADEVARMLITWMVFYAAAGGQDLDGGLPDVDFQLGIGHHRSVYSHSILLGLETEFALRFGLAVLKHLIARMRSNRHPVWDRIDCALDRYGECTLSGMWLGIGAHLLKDANFLTMGGTKPVVGLPFSMSMGAHKAFLAANGVASVAMGTSGHKRGCSSCLPVGARR